MNRFKIKIEWNDLEEAYYRNERAGKFLSLGVRKNSTIIIWKRDGETDEQFESRTRWLIEGRMLNLRDNRNLIGLPTIDSVIVTS